MGKFAKLIISIVAGLLVLVVGAMVLATVLIDPNDYKGEITKIVREKTGRDLAFQGDLELSVFPWIGVSTGGITLSNAPGFEEQNMFSLKSAQVSVKLMPLFSGKVELSTVDVSDLQLYLMRNAKGVSNWDDLTKKEQQSAQEDKTDPSPTESGSGSKLNLSVAGVNIQNARVVWDDQMEKVRKAVDDCDVTVEGFAPGAPFKFNVHVAASSTKPEVNADINLSGTAELSDDFKMISVDGVNLAVDASGQAVPGGKASVTMKSDAAIDMLKGTADVTGLVLEAYGMKSEGGLKATGLNGQDISFSGNFNVPSFNLKDTMQQMAMPLKTADDKALTSVGMNFDFSGTKNSVEIKNLMVNLDETSIKGLFSFANPERPNIVAQVDVDKINVDRYLPPKDGNKAEQKPAKKESTKTSGEKQELIPVELLRKLTLKADLGVQQLIASKAKINDIVVKARIKNGVLSVKPASFNIAKGAFTSTTVVDARGKQPVSSVVASLTGMESGALAKDMTGADSFSGKANFNSKLKTRGNDLKTIYSNLDGNLGFKIEDGHVSGFDIIYMASDAFSVLTGGKSSSQDRKRTDFGELSATATINKGVAVNKDLLLKSPLLRASGAGSMNLNTMIVDYALDAKIVGTFEGQGGKGMKELIGLTVPVTVKGDVADPSIMVDLPRFAAILAQSGVSVVGDVLKGVGGVIDSLSNTIGGKKSSGDTSTEEKKKDPVKDIGNAIQKLF